MENNELIINLITFNLIENTIDSRMTVNKVIEWVKTFKTKKDGFNANDFFKYLNDLLSFDDSKVGYQIVNKASEIDFSSFKNKIVYDIKKKKFFSIEEQFCFLSLSSPVAKTHAGELYIYLRSLGIETCSVCYENNTGYGFSNLIVIDLEDNKLKTDIELTKILHSYVSSVNYSKNKEKES